MYALCITPSQAASYHRCQSRLVSVSDCRVNQELTAVLRRRASYFCLETRIASCAENKTEPQIFQGVFRIPLNLFEPPRPHCVNGGPVKRRRERLGSMHLFHVAVL